MSMHRDEFGRIKDETVPPPIVYGQTFKVGHSKHAPVWMCAGWSGEKIRYHDPDAPKGDVTIMMKEAWTQDYIRDMMADGQWSVVPWCRCPGTHKYQCTECGVKRDNLWEAWYPMREERYTFEDAFLSALEETDPNEKVEDCDHYGSTEKYFDGNNEPFYYCDRCGTDADTISQLLQKKGDGMASKRTRRRKAARKRAQAEKQAKRDFPILTGETFRTTTSGAAQSYTCAGWTDEGLLQYASKGLNDETLVTVQTWTKEYVTKRIEDGHWVIDGKSDGKVNKQNPSKKCNKCWRNFAPKNQETCGACKDRKTCARCYKKLDDPKCTHTGSQQYLRS